MKFNRSFNTDRPKQASSSEMIYGVHPILEALRNQKELDRILILDGSKSEQLFEIKQLAKEQGIYIQYVPIQKLNKITTKNHQGIIAWLSMVTYHKVEDLLPNIFEKGEEPLFIMLDRVTDVRNMGAIARSAACAGAHAIIIPDKGSARINEDAIKSSAGALMSIPVCREHNLKDTIDYLKDSGITLLACSEKADQNLFDTEISGPLCIIMGSEEEGISPEYMKKADLKVKIPMYGTISSLNVSVAAGIVLFDVLRKRV